MHKVKARYVRSKSNNPWHNLAIEEYLLEDVQDNEFIMYLWQNENTVVIGKNQNPWRECDLKTLHEDGGKLARRLSGGGAVYHDLGNLNFTFIMKNNLYDLEKQLNIIISSLKSLGIDAEFSGRNDIVVGGRKISGNAFYYTDKASLHHGTLLVNSDIKRLSSYLKVSKEKIQSKGIDSVKSRVVNLIDIKPDISIEKIASALRATLYNLYDVDREVTIEGAEVLDSKLYKKFSSWDWIYGETPEFDITLEKRFSWGGVEIGLKLDGAYIKEAKVYSDSMNYLVMDKIGEALKGLPFSKESIIDALDGLNVGLEEGGIIPDLKRWILEKKI